MLTLYTSGGEILQAPADTAVAALMPQTVWIDLLRPTPAETAVVERTTGLHLPSLEDISEIESSSRLRAEHGVLYLSAPLIHRATEGMPLTTPVGFVLSADRLVTVRFETLTAFDALAKAPVADSAPEAFAALIEAIVDRLADVLEHIAAELDTLSHRLFRAGPIGAGKRRRPAHE